MMKLEDQVCTLEQAKRLSELGIAQDALFYFNRMRDSTGSYYRPESYRSENGYAAFTVAELGVMLPKDHQWSWPEREDMTQWACARCVDLHRGAEATAVHYGPTEAQARAALLIHLLSVRAITPDEVNTRLTNK